MEKRLKWGFLGAGGIAQAVAQDFAIAGIIIHAVGARSIASAQGFAEKNNIANSYGSYQELVNDPEIDIVYVNTIHPLHCEHALLAINAGKHVLVEKPFTINAGQALKIRDAAARMKVFVLEAMWTRFLPAHLALNKYIADGVIGEIRTIIADHSQYLPYPKHARLWEPELGGGALLDLGIYPISFAQRFLGNPVKIFSTAQLTDKFVDENTTMVFEYSRGETALMSTCLSVAGPVSAIILGTNGRIEIDQRFYAQSTFRIYNQANKAIVEYNQPIEGVGHRYQGLESERCVNEGLLESPLMDLQSSIDIMKSMDEVRKQIGVKYSNES